MQHLRAALLKRNSPAFAGLFKYLQPTTVGGIRQAHSLESHVSKTQSLGDNTNWIFLGPPGVGKGTYAKRIAKLAGIPHISTGDLVREEIKSGSPLAEQMKEVTSKGGLLPDAMVLDILRKRLDAGKQSERGFLLDGFPRTASQAAALSQIADVGLVVNLGLREDVMVEKCCGRRICKQCGNNYNIADIYRPAEDGKPEIVMPPLNPPAECADKMEQRPDDTEEVVKARLKVYAQECGPVEEHYRQAGLLLDFEIVGGIPETLPRLLDAMYGELANDCDRSTKVA